MKLIRLLFLAVLSLWLEPVSGQLILNPYTISSASDDLVLDNQTITFSATDYRKDTHTFGNQLFQNHCIYKDGDTHLLLRMNYNTFLSRGLVLSYYDGIGLDRPHQVAGQVGSNNHSRMSGIFVGDRAYFVQEEPHDTPLRIYRAQNENDVYSFEYQAEEIGTKQSYPQLFKLTNGNNVVLGQGINSSLTAINIGDSNFANWSADTQIAESITATNYQATPLNFMANSGWRYFTIHDRESGGSEFPWRERYLVKTQDFDTFYNFDESFSVQHSVDGDITAAELNTHFLYYSTPGNADGLNPVAALDADENFYAVTWNGSDSYIYISRLQGEPDFTEVTIDLGTTNYVHDTLNIAQGTAIPLLIPFSATDQRIVARQNLDGLAKFYMYKTVDRGQSWTLVDQMFPGVETDFGLITTVQNFKDIPENKTFFFAATQLLTNETDDSELYIQKAAIGSLQSENTPYTNPYSFAEFNALTGLMRSYFCEDPFITRVGANVSALLDQSPVGEDATGSNNPQYASDDGEYVSLNGSTQSFRINNSSDILALNQGTIIAVARKNTTVNVNGNILVASNSAATTDRFAFSIHTNTFNNSIGHHNTGSEINTSQFTTYGSDAVGSDWVILVWQMSDGTCSAQWINGKKQVWNREVSSGGTVNERTGYFFDKQSTLNVLDVGRLDRSSTDLFYDFHLKHLSIFNRPLTFEEINRATSFLADRYGITLDSHFQWCIFLFVIVGFEKRRREFRPTSLLKAA